MSKRDAKLLAQIWADEPLSLIRDLRELIDWVEETAIIAQADGTATTPGAPVADPAMAVEVLQRLIPIESALREYRRMMPPTPLNIDLLQPVRDAFSTAAETDRKDAGLANLSAIRHQVNSLEQWARSQSQRMSEAPNRSELLKTTIEVLEDEIIVRTDTNGSLKLLGSTSIPMFLALWKAPKHRMSPESFLDIDRRTSEKNLDRHRARLCSKLQKVLLEVVADESGVRMQKCR
jgi:hypothetical protein